MKPYAFLLAYRENFSNYSGLKDGKNVHAERLNSRLIASWLPKVMPCKFDVDMNEWNTTVMREIYLHMGYKMSEKAYDTGFGARNRWDILLQLQYDISLSCTSIWRVVECLLRTVFAIAIFTYISLND